MPRGPFEQANIAVVEAAYLNVEYTQTATAVASPQSRPSAASDGQALRKSTRSFIVAKPSAGQTMDVEVYAYFADIAQWVHLVEADRTGIDEYGDSWKINTGGADRIAVRVSTLSGGTANAWLARSYV